MNPVSRVLLLIPTKSYRASDFLKAAKKLQIEVAVGSNQKSVLEKFTGAFSGRECDKMPRRVLTVDFKNHKKGLEQILKCAAEHPFHSVIGTDENTVLLATRTAEALGLPHNPVEATEACWNKAILREKLENAEIPSPHFKIFSIEKDLTKASREVTYPCVLKPLTLSASCGVIRANNPKEFKEAFVRIKKILNTLSDDSVDDILDQILVEDFIPGVEVALEGMLRAGRLTVLALFDKPDLLDGPYFEETLYITPSRLSQKIQNQIIKTTQKAVQALELREGPIHAEIRVNEDAAWVIEVAARSIGGLCSRVLEFGGGVKLEEIILFHSLGLDTLGLISHKASGVMMIPIPKAGVFKKINGLENAKKMPGIVDVTINIPLGKRLVPLPEGRKYLGFIFCHGITPQFVEDSLRKAHVCLSFEIN